MSPHDLSKTHDAYLMRYACRIYDGSTKGYGIPDGRALAGRQKNANNQKEVHSVNVLVLTIMVLGLSVPEGDKPGSFEASYSEIYFLCP
jgi:hypothetical protein